MNNVHGIIYAYHAYPKLRDLISHRTGASLPFCGRYRLIDFALSSLKHAGIRDVGVIMQRDYQSLMDHLGSGQAWDMSRRSGGLKLLPPFGLPDSHKGVYEGCMEALSAVMSYIEAIKQDYVVLIRGDLCANIDIAEVVDQHMESGADVTAVCSDHVPEHIHHRFVPDENGFAKQILCRQLRGGKGVTATENYVLSKKRLMELISWCAEGSRLHFHRDALTHLMLDGGTVGIYMHNGYTRNIVSVDGYYSANMDMLNGAVRSELFRPDRYIATLTRNDVSTYYSDRSLIKNSLVADGCLIEGSLENCILFGGVKVGEGSALKNCIIMNNTVIDKNVQLKYVISDKNAYVSPYVTMSGNEKLPLVIPKDASL